MNEVNRAVESSGLWKTTETAISSCGRRPSKFAFSVIWAVYWCRQCQRWSRPRVVLFPWLQRSTQLTEVSFLGTAVRIRSFHIRYSSWRRIHPDLCLVP